MFIRVSSAPFVVRYFDSAEYGIATKSRLLEIIGFFCKRALQKRRYSAKETYHFKEPTNRSHPIPVIYLYRLFFEHFPKKEISGESGTYACEYAVIHVKICIHTQAFMCIHTRTFTHIYICVYVYTRIHTAHTRRLYPYAVAKWREVLPWWLVALGSAPNLRVNLHSRLCPFCDATCT